MVVQSSAVSIIVVYNVYCNLRGNHIMLMCSMQHAVKKKWCLNSIIAMQCWKQEMLCKYTSLYEVVLS